MKRRLLVALLSQCAGALVAVGCTGPAGMTGAQGSSGMSGAQGVPGMTGAQGTAGMTGVQGSTGMTGVQGPTGLTGAQGATAPIPSPQPAIRWTSLKDFMFDYDRSDIRYSESRKPAEIATYMSQNPSVQLGIDGYTDSRGTSQCNLPLSQRRVASARDSLIQAGVPSDRIETGTFGTGRLACNSSTEQCSPREGRVEVLVRAGN